ncbi:protein kinase 4 [Stomoxys calcitrans]|uniref:Protein stand still n=1 Tax=Stomoxys calcitrans TaxID=35570 RepID=A0A1I8NW20_STOCA|nr:protein kinase 4 [Stomoxys calcitrans]
MEDHTEETNDMIEMLKSEVLQSQQIVVLGCRDDKRDNSMQQQNDQNKSNASESLVEIQHATALTNNNSPANIIMLNQGFPNSDDPSNKLHHQMRHVHIPYILNGELYQIQTQDGENVTVKCCHCPPDRVYRGSVRSTGNFHMHIKRRHPDLLEKLHDMKVNALLERRDRLIRNRKINSRNNRNRLNSLGITTSTPNNKEDPKSNLVQQQVQSSSPADNSTSELSLLHTHKLKIKTVFQRHQMQQKEAAEMRDASWNHADYVVLPITNMATSGQATDGPINYSLKSQERMEILEQQQQPTCVSTQILTQQQPSSSSHQQQHVDIALTNAVECVNIPTATKTQTTNVFECTTNNEYVYENQQNNISRDLSTATTATQSSLSSSELSTFSSVNNNTNNKNNGNPVVFHQPHNGYASHHHQTLSIIKPEELLTPFEHQAIDLTLHTDSGIYSNSNESVTNNNSQNSTTENRAGSQHTPHSHTPQTTHCENNCQKWQELLIHVESSLRDIQHEMNIRNQIESNRMFLDIAKFKFLHPSFQFNW